MRELIPPHKRTVELTLEIFILELFSLFILTFSLTTHIITVTHLTRLEGESGFRIAITGFFIASFANAHMHYSHYHNHV